MLYEAWLKTVRLHRNDVALVEAGHRWTFAQLADEAEKKADLPVVVYPTGISSRFIIEVLQGWRNQRVVCPLDTEQTSLPPISTPLPSGCVHLKTSSGSTGEPRFIAFTSEQLSADAENIVATMGLRRDWPNVAAISIAHSYGFSNLVLPLLLHGIPVVLCPSRLPEAFRSALETFENATVADVPALWNIWHSANVITPRIKLAISAGAPLPVDLERAVFESSGVKIHNFYGASECGGICYDRSEFPRISGQDVGSPMLNVAVDVNETGCLRVRSRAVGQGYWPNPYAALAKGSFQTTDRVEIRDGRVLLLGRDTDVINIAGQKVSPDSIEQALLKHPLVSECVVFGVPAGDSARHETIAACVATRGNLEAEELKQFLLKTIPPAQVPKHWKFVPSLADPHRGKISRFQWRQRFLAGQ
ncbi:MAG: AMP-dependent synthetase and ligase [Verrucomicrobiales bacterium]|nr:AMP-dependent synthetase and ligase [Verrucomicrobiales bacterium]